MSQITVISTLHFTMDIDQSIFISVSSKYHNIPFDSVQQLQSDMTIWFNQNLRLYGFIRLTMIVWEQHIVTQSICTRSDIEFWRISAFVLPVSGIRMRLDIRRNQISIRDLLQWKLNPISGGEGGEYRPPLRFFFVFL